MKLLFKAETPGNPTIEETNFSNHYPSVHKQMAWKSLQPFVRQATETYILKYIDAATYDSLATKYQDNTVLSASEEILLEKLQDTIAYYTIYDALPHINVTIGDKGVQQTSSTDGSSTPSNQWSYKNTRWSVIQKADQLFDQLLTWIEARIKDSDALFDTFKASPEYTRGQSGVFKSPSEVQNFIDIKSSRRTFLALIPFFEKAAKKHVIPLTCTDLWNELTGQVKANSLTADNQKLLDVIQPVVAEYGAMLAIPHLAINMEDSGFRISSESDGMSYRSNLANQQHMQAIEALKYQLESDAKTFKAELITFLAQNVDDYPLYKDSGCYNPESDNAASVISHGPGGVML